MPHMMQQQQQKPSMYGQPGMDMQSQVGQDHAGMPGQNIPPALVRTSSDQVSFYQSSNFLNIS